MVGNAKGFMMSKPYIHAMSSARKFGGRWEDYFSVHNFMDSSKAAYPNHSHRVATHQSFFLGQILERIWFPNSCPMTSDGRFPTIINSNGHHISVRDIGEQHVSEDYHGFIPSLQDFCQLIDENTPWLNNGKGTPPSMAQIVRSRPKSENKFIPFGKQSE